MRNHRKIHEKIAPILPGCFYFTLMSMITDLTSHYYEMFYNTNQFLHIFLGLQRMGKEEWPRTTAPSVKYDPRSDILYGICTGKLQFFSRTVIHCNSLERLKSIKFKAKEQLRRTSRLHRGRRTAVEFFVVSRKIRSTIK